jgi:hypothetical protein
MLQIWTCIKIESTIFLELSNDHTNLAKLIFKGELLRILEIYFTQGGKFIGTTVHFLTLSIYIYVRIADFSLRIYKN